MSDPFNNHIARLDAGGDLSGTWSVPEGPVGVAVRPDGRYSVSLRDTGKVTVHDDSLAFPEFLADGDPMVDFVQPMDIDIAADTRHVYIVDGASDTVYGFTLVPATGAPSPRPSPSQPRGRRNAVDRSTPR